MTEAAPLSPKWIDVLKRWITRGWRTAVDKAGKLDQLFPARFHDEARALPRRLLGDRDETAAVREQLRCALEDVAANGVEDHIKRADSVVELCAAVDHLICPE